jgi:4-hydroxythreonine-4-phosphate dehydrogenase
VKTRQLLAITMGDPAGIGPEIIVKLFKHTPPNDTVVYGDVQQVKRTITQLGLNLRVRQVQHVNDLTNNHTSQDSLVPTIPVLQACDRLPPEIPMGQCSAAAGRAAYQCVQRAIDDALNGQIAGLVTAPLNKKSIEIAGFNFPGHTEILAHRCGDVPVAMMLANEEIRTVLVTIHIPLSAVSGALTVQAELQAIGLAHEGCMALGIEHPRIAVAGLNPHAGEAGKFGDEEARIIEPAIEAAKAQGIDVSGPWPGDTVFGQARQGAFDVVVAQYHDQGLIPVKYLGLDQGVNITIGLPFVRTSVDHGTAFDIAGRDLASPASLHQAVQMARTLLARQR